jgi:hypothetical protein
MKVFKKIVKLIASISASSIILMLSVFYIYGNFDFPEAPSRKTVKAVKIDSFYGFVFNTSDLSLIKNAGFNTIVVSPLVFVVRGKVISPPFSYTTLGFISRKAHLEGLNVMVMPEVIRLDRDREYLEQRLFKDYLLAYHQSLARFCARAGIRYFCISPSSYNLFNGNAIKWLEDTCAECRVYYKGSMGFLADNILSSNGSDGYRMEMLCLKGSLTGQIVSLKIPTVKGFDFAVFSSFPPPEARNLELYTVDFLNFQQKLKTISLRNGLGEAFYFGLNVSRGAKPGTKMKAPVVTRSQQKIFLENMLRIAAQNNLNFIIYDWDSKEFGIKDDDLLKTVGKSLKNGSSE